MRKTWHRLLNWVLGKPTKRYECGWIDGRCLYCGKKCRQDRTYCNRCYRYLYPGIKL